MPLNRRRRLHILGRLGAVILNRSSGDLRALFDQCHIGSNDAAWEQVLAWLRVRARSVLGGFQTLNDADREDVISHVGHRLIEAIRRREIRGTTDAEIESYVRTTLKNRALNVVRHRATRGQEEPVPEDLHDNAPSPSEQAVIAQALERARDAIMKWPPEDRYLFIAKLEGVSSARIKATLEQPPYRQFVAITTVDTRYLRLRRILHEQVNQ